MSDDTLAAARAILAECEGMTEGTWHAILHTDALFAGALFAAELSRSADRRGIVALANGRPVFAALIAEVERLREVFVAQNDSHRAHVKGLLEQHAKEREIYGTAAQGFRERAEAAEADADLVRTKLATEREITAHLTWAIEQLQSEKRPQASDEAERDRLKAELSAANATAADLSQIAAVYCGARDRLSRELQAIADYVQPHWRGAGLPLEAQWIVEEIADRAKAVDAANDERDRLRVEKDRLHRNLQGERQRADEAVAELDRVIEGAADERDRLRAENERLRAERQRLDRRIRNQRLALRANWQIVEARDAFRRRACRRFLKISRAARAALNGEAPDA